MKRIFNKETRDWDLIPSEGYGPNKMLVSDADGNPKWDSHGYMQTKEVFTYDGNYAKTDSATSGGTTNTLYASMFTLAKISDYVPTVEELFSDETTATFGSGEVGVNIPDLKHVYDGYYGRFKFTMVPSTAKNPCSEDGLFPGIVVVAKPSLVFEVFDCYEPGIYIWTSSLGKKYATQSVTISRVVPMDSSVPYVKRASVGQTIAVKAVDENGKPTEWEAVDMGGGSGNIAYFFANNNDEYLYHVDSATGKIGEIATAKDVTMALGRHIYITDMPGDNGYAYLEFKLPYMINTPAYDGDNAAITLLGHGENDVIITRYYKTAEYSSGGK